MVPIIFFYLKASDESRTNMKDSSYNITTSGEKGGHDALGSSANLKDKPTSGKSRTAGALIFLVILNIFY